MKTEQFVVVDVASKRVLVRLAEIREIVSMVQLSGEISDMGNCRGLFNLRGEAVPVFDLRGATAPLTPSRFILVSQSESSAIGVIVDDVIGVVSVESDRVATRSLDHGRTLDCAEIDGQLLTIVCPREVPRS